MKIISAMIIFAIIIYCFVKAAIELHDDLNKPFEKSITNTRRN